MVSRRAGSALWHMPIKAVNSKLAGPQLELTTSPGFRVSAKVLVSHGEGIALSLNPQTGIAKNWGHPCIPKAILC